MCCALILALGLFYGIANYENVYETKENKVKPRTSCTTKYSTLNIKPALRQENIIRDVIVTKALFPVSIESSFASANV